MKLGEQLLNENCKCCGQPIKGESGFTAHYDKGANELTIYEYVHIGICGMGEEFGTADINKIVLRETIKEFL